jgi:hypothetical protein
MNEHHLVLGQMVDFLTGRIVDDTHDERYRQKIARLLVEIKGYPKGEIRSGQTIDVRAGAKMARVRVSFTVALDHHTAMLIQYGPGSLTTRHRPALALGRLVNRHQVPIVVVTNGETADILDGVRGRVLATGLENIPSRRELRQSLSDHDWTPIASARLEMEARIVMAYEVDDRCPCDSDVCSWPSRQ